MIGVVYDGIQVIWDIEESAEYTRLEKVLWNLYNAYGEVEGPGIAGFLWKMIITMINSSQSSTILINQVGLIPNTEQRIIVR